MGGSTISVAVMMAQCISASDQYKFVGAPFRLFATKHGAIEGFSVSPDGKAIAFSNDRGDHGFIGIYKIPPLVAEGRPPEFAAMQTRIQWVDPSYDTVSSSRRSSSSSSTKRRAKHAINS